MFYDNIEEGHPDRSEETDIHFYYNRDERLARAPEIVQKAYNGGMRPVTVIKIFFTKENRFILLGLVVFVAFVWIYTGVNHTRNRISINGINCELQAFSFDEQIYVTLKLTAGKKYDSNVPEKINVDFFLIDNNSQVNQKDSQTVVFSGSDEVIRLKCTDYDIMRVDGIINAGGEEKEISAAIKR